MSTGPGASARQIHQDAERVRRAIDAELALTRGRATSWAKGVGALLVAGLAFTLIRGRSDVAELAIGFSVAVGVLLLVAVLVAIVAAYYLFGAAYGRLHPNPLETSDHELANETMKDLRTGLVWALLGGLALVSAIAVTWYGPAADGPQLRIVDARGAEWCGEPVRTDGGVVTLKIKSQEVPVDTANAASISAVSSCAT